MSKKRIFVGTEYEEAFHSIYELIQGGCFAEEPYMATNGVIFDGRYEYVLTDKKREESQEVRHGFEQDGATWFKALRGDKLPDDDAIWNSFRSNLVIEYHKHFSVVEYKKQPPTVDEKKRALATAKLAVQRFCNTFYPDLGAEIELVQKEASDAFENIYGISLKIEISGGTGASVPVLGKVYFSRKDKMLEPLAKGFAESIEQNINKVIPDEDDTPPMRDDSVFDDTLNSLDAIINGAGYNFADYLYFANEEDNKVIDGLLKKLSHDSFELECQRVDVLYITHIQTNAFEFSAYVQGVRAFDVRIGVNESVSISCGNCAGKAMLVDRNQIQYADAKGSAKVANLDFSREGLGLSQNALEQIRATGAQRDHFISVSCSKIGCLVHKCRSQIFEVDVNGEIRNVCKDCRRPEIVYTTMSGEKLYTPSLTFAFDKLELVGKKVETAKCSVCGRAFSRSALRTGKCPTCIKADKEADDAAKARYKTYKNFLPILARLGGGTRACYEDEEILLFVVGKKRYVFNKLNVKEIGYVSKPKQV